MQNKNVWAGVGIIIVLALITAGIIWLRPMAPSSVQNATSTPSQEGTTTSLGNGISVTSNGSGTISAVSGIPAPSLTRPISISSSLPTDTASTLRANEETVSAQLKQNPRRSDLWLQLAVDRKVAGDYQGAIDIWNYVAKTGPDTVKYIAYGNLGDVYQNFLKDYPKAEMDYKAAIAINPHIIGYYSSLYTMYKYLYKTNTSAAADILVQGLKANPGNSDLLTLQKQ